MSNVRDDILLSGLKGQIYEELLNNSDGVEISDLIEKFKTTKGTIYTSINILNRNSKGFIIYNINRKYYIKKSKTIPIVNKLKKEVANTFTDLDIPNNIISKIKSLPISDMNDVLDMLKKAYYYRRSAEALIQSNEMINKIMEKLNF